MYSSEFTDYQEDVHNLYLYNVEFWVYWLTYYIQKIQNSE